MNKHIVFLLITLPFLTQCKTQQNSANIMTTYEYLDGNNNKYTITPTNIIYDPVRPEQSSTGLYSGGEPYTAPLEEKQFKDMEEVIKKSISNADGQIDSRNKGTGMLIVLPEKKSYIFEMNSEQKKEIEAVILLYTRR